MSEVLVRIRVRETAGIRRFLYPLSAYVHLPEGADAAALCLVTEDGKAVPLQVTVDGEGRQRCDFAVSLDPLAEQKLDVVTGGPKVHLDDPLSITRLQDGGFRSLQKRFRIEVDGSGNIAEVIYDGVDFLGPRKSTANHNGLPQRLHSVFSSSVDSKLNAWVQASGDYPTLRHGEQRRVTLCTEVSACKSWAFMRYRLEETVPNDSITFSLPLNFTQDVVTYDVGAGGGIYGKMERGTNGMRWVTELVDGVPQHWSVESIPREDYVGNYVPPESFLSQRWLHILDSDKVMAVAITNCPRACRELEVVVNTYGVAITFQLGKTYSGPADFGVCYHFLNGVPAIAAATNPQSILLPPVVEVLPV